MNEIQYLKLVPPNSDLTGSLCDFHTRVPSIHTLYQGTPGSQQDSAAQERMLSGGRRKSRILRYLQRAYPSPLLSFAAWRLTQREVVALIPEIERTESTFRDRRAWCEKMQAYNATVRRGVHWQLGLAPCLPHTATRPCQWSTFDQIMMARVSAQASAL